MSQDVHNFQLIVEIGIATKLTDLVSVHSDGTLKLLPLLLRQMQGILNSVYIEERFDLRYEGSGE